MTPPIDPTHLTNEDIPYILGVLAAQMEQNSKDHLEMKEVLKDHDECLQIFKFSKCKLLPWLGRNRWIVAALFMGLSIWFSSLDWLNRWLQWAFFPPK